MDNKPVQRINKISVSGNVDLTEINTLLSNKADKGVSYTKSESDGKYSTLTALNLKADKTALTSKADVSALPTKTSQLTNDSSFVTTTDLATKANTGVSYTKAESDGKYATTTSLATKANSTDLANKADKTQITTLETSIGSISTSLSDKADKTTVTSIANSLNSTVKTVNGVAPVNGNVTINVDASNIDTSNLATKTELNTTNSNISLKADKTYVDNALSNIGSASPKGVYATLASLQSAFPTGNNNVYLVSADGKWYYWNGTAWTSGGVYQTAFISDTLKRDIYKKSNLNFILGTLSTTTHEHTSSNSRAVTKDYIKVPSGSVIKNINFNVTDFAVNTFTTESGTAFVSDTGWLTAQTQFAITSDCYIKIVIRNKTANDDIRSSLSDVAAGIEIEIPASFRLSNIEDKLSTNSNKITNIEVALDGLGLGNEEIVVQNTLDSTVKAVAHRGYSYTAPENVLSAYVLAKRKGFSYVECDVSWTSDGVPVLLHDDTINRTARLSGGASLTETVAINSITLAQAQTYDFGIWKNANYTGEKIPTLQQFIKLCKRLELHPYIELKGALTSAQVTTLLNIVKKEGMQRNVTWIAMGTATISEILLQDVKARVGYVWQLTEASINQVETWRNEGKEVFLDVEAASVTDTLISNALLKGIPVEVWTVNDSGSVIPFVDKGVSGITTDLLNVRQIMQAVYKL